MINFDITREIPFEVYSKHTESGRYSDIDDKEKKKYWEFLTFKSNILHLQVATQLGKPAVEGIDKQLAKTFTELNNSQEQTNNVKRIKMMIGHMTKVLMETTGYKVKTSGRKIKGNVFSTGSVFEETPQTQKILDMLETSIPLNFDHNGVKVVLKKELLEYICEFESHDPPFKYKDSFNIITIKRLIDLYGIDHFKAELVNSVKEQIDFIKMRYQNKRS